VANIVLVEDDARIRTALVQALEERGHAVRAFGSGFPALDAIVEEPPEVVILDLGLPDIDGTDLLIEIRKVSQVPVIVATARDDDASAVATLHAGADDYVVKPFSVAQIDARIAAVLRRSQSNNGDPTIRIGGLVIDPRRHSVELDGVAVQLNRKEFELLAYLAGREGLVVSKQELLAEVWRQPWGGSEKTVDVHLSWLRRKLGETATEPNYITAVRGVGVVFAAPPGSNSS
jgi:DNA-binding response OmpR family regulator